MASEELRRKADYLERVTRGEGFMPWQAQERLSPEEAAFREEMERRKEALLAGRMRVKHPALLTEGEVAQARRNLSKAEWARRWLRGHREIADHIVR